MYTRRSCTNNRKMQILWINLYTTFKVLSPKSNKSKWKLDLIIRYFDILSTIYELAQCLQVIYLFYLHKKYAARHEKIHFNRSVSSPEPVKSMHTQCYIARSHHSYRILYRHSTYLHVYQNRPIAGLAWLTHSYTRTHSSCRRNITDVITDITGMHSIFVFNLKSISFV